ncbi:MAG: hypothetical protein UH625_09285 [Muribaculaceae bacterium]|nr:hypothetical protein [Muribaculaceae bacterium]
MQSASLRATKPIIILQSVNLTGQSLTYRTRISRTLSAACQWVRCNCTPRNIFRALFCENVSMAVAAVLICFMWWHNITIEDNIAAGEAVATYCLYALPWGIVWAIRATLADFKAAKKGGKA